jgi:hypothetical protein
MRRRSRAFGGSSQRSSSNQEGFTDEFVNVQNQDVGLDVRARQRAGFCIGSRMAAGCFLRREYGGLL